MSRVGKPTTRRGTAGTSQARLAAIPSVDEVLKTPVAAGAIEQYGRPAVVGAVRASLADVRKRLRNGGTANAGVNAFAAAALAKLESEARPNGV
jgi:L-seryl-tRNA(Ser) seleniumtransferase